MDKKLAYTYLKNQPLTKGLNESELNYLWEIVENVTFKPNQVIIREGEESTDLYIIAVGGVNVLKWDNQHINQILISSLGVGQSFGELAFLDGSIRSTTIKATRNTEVMKLSRSKLLEEKDKTILNQILLNIGAINSSRLQLTNTLYVKNLETNTETSEKRISHGRVILFGYMILFFCATLSTLYTGSLLYFVPWVLSIVPILFLFNSYGFSWKLSGFNLDNWLSVITISLGVSLLSVGVSYLIYKWIFTNFHRTTVLGQNVFLKNVFFTDFDYFSALCYGFLGILVEIVARGILQTSLQNFLQDKLGYKTVSLNAIFLFIVLLPLGFGLAFSFFLLSLPLGYFFFQQQSLLGVCLIHFILCFAGVINF